MPGSRELHSPTTTSYCLAVIVKAGMHTWVCHWHMVLCEGKQQKPERVLPAINAQLSHNLHFCEFWLFKEHASKIHVFDIDIFKT